MLDVVVFEEAVSSKIYKKSRKSTNELSVQTFKNIAKSKIEICAVCKSYYSMTFM